MEHRKLFKFLLVWWEKNKESTISKIMHGIKGKININTLSIVKNIIGSLLWMIIPIFILTSMSCEKRENLKKEKPKTEKSKKEILHWTCGMHPSVRISPEDYEKSRPKCPICNMDLVPVYRGRAKKEALPILTLSSYSKELTGVKTEEVTYRRLVKEIRTVGKIDYDEREVAYVTAWIDGRIEKLYADFTGAKVKKGEPLALIYSPKLISTQEEYLLALETLDKVKDSHIPEVVENAESLVEATKKRLLLWGIPEKEIKRLEQERKTNIYMTIYSPIDGTVVEKSVIEGKYVKEGEHLYTVAKLSNLWMFADIYEYEMPWIRLGQEVEITTPAYPEETFIGKITFIDPVLHPETRSIKTRTHLPNPEGKLKPEMFVEVKIKIPITKRIFPTGLFREVERVEVAIYKCDCSGKTWTQNRNKKKECPYCGSAMPDCGTLLKTEEKRTAPDKILCIPKSSLLDTGKRKVVYVDKGEGRYEMREVKVGPQVGEYYPVLEGVKEGERVVVRGNFLIDSETQLTGPAATMYDAAIGKRK